MSFVIPWWILLSRRRMLSENSLRSDGSSSSKMPIVQADTCMHAYAFRLCFDSSGTTNRNEFYVALCVPLDVPLRPFYIAGKEEA